MGLTRISGDVIQTPLNVGVVTVTSLTVGTGVTISGGIVTATSFSGNVTGNVTGNITGNVTGNVNSTGLSTFSRGLLVGTGASVSSPASNVLTLGTNNVEIVRITSSGNIGIGTTNPLNKLVISGTIGINELNAVAGYSSTGRTLFSTSQSGFVLNHNDNSSIILQTQGIERIRITDSGHLILPAGSFDLMVGDSVDSNAGTQTISVGSTASGSGGIQLWANPTNGNSYIQFGDNSAAASQYRGWVNYQHATDMLNFGTAGTERFRIDSSGRVTMPYQPMAYVTYTGAALVRSTIIPFTAVTNQGNHWDNGSYRFTCPVAGIYHASLNMTGNSTQSVQVQTYVRQNGNNMAVSYYPGGPVSISILCSANDTIDFVYNHDNAGYNGGTPAYASVHLVG